MVQITKKFLFHKCELINVKFNRNASNVVVFRLGTLIDRHYCILYLSTMSI